MTKHWFQSEEDRQRDKYPWTDNPKLGSTASLCVPPIETALNKPMYPTGKSTEYNDANG